MRKELVELTQLYVGRWCGHALTRARLIDFNIANQGQNIIATCPCCADAAADQNVPYQLFEPTGLFVFIPPLEKRSPKPRPNLRLIQGGKNKHY